MALILLLHRPSEMEIMLKVQKPDNVESHKFWKLSVTNILVVGSEFFLGSNSIDILALYKANSEDTWK